MADETKGWTRDDMAARAVDSTALRGRILHIPSRDAIPTPINEQLIVELYSK